MTSVSSQLEFYFVAFLDVLGFSDMVKSDCESPSGSELYMKKLFDIHEQTLKNHKSNKGLEIVQFSDSIVLAMPFFNDNFPIFIKLIADFQYDLFDKGFLCRGGIAYGKHFSKEGFLFSNGLIEAYQVEKDIAKYPRVAVSNDLIELIYKDKLINDDIPLIMENDTIFFVDFLANKNLNDSAICLQAILNHAPRSKPSVMEKHRWLTEYFDHKASNSDYSISKFGKPRFSDSMEIVKDVGTNNFATISNNI